MKTRKRALTWVLVAALTTFVLGLWITPNAAGQVGVSTVTLSPNVLNFPPQLAGTTSLPETVTLMYSATATQPLIISSIVLTGLFSQTNTCPTAPATVAPGTTCTFNITFAPLTGGPTAGLIAITDSAVPSVQAISLGGTGEDFSLAASPASATLTAGQSAKLTVTVTPAGGFNQAVTLTCSGLPTGAGCAFSPNPVTPDGTNPAQVSLTISTSARAISDPGRGPNWPPPHAPIQASHVWLWTLLIAACMLGVRARRFAPRLAGVTLAMLFLAALGVFACGGGSGGGSGGSSGTPAGTYSVSVNGSTPAGSTSLQNVAAVNLVVH